MLFINPEVSVLPLSRRSGDRLLVNASYQVLRSYLLRSLAIADCPQHIEDLVWLGYCDLVFIELVVLQSIYRCCSRVVLEDELANELSR
jgi:hypothetical protein